MNAINLTTTNVNETMDLGYKIGSLLRAGDIIALIGDLGSGKTWLAKGIAFGLEVPEHEYVNSPAFDLVHEYSGRLPVYHMDFYRLDALSEEDLLWISEYLDYDGVCIIEWANKFIQRLATEYLSIDISAKPDDDVNARKIVITGDGERYHKLIEDLRRVV